ncbi:hypothetical protein OBV_18680 [Oscillibacter valericigenes Sjm18-20]|nr:hypothetical protein OBV_18680 [Oscillibacter valericigenes Sjm18-20]
MSKREPLRNHSGSLLREGRADAISGPVKLEKWSALYEKMSRRIGFARLSQKALAFLTKIL